MQEMTHYIYIQSVPLEIQPANKDLFKMVSKLKPQAPYKIKDFNGLLLLIILRS